MAMSRGSLKAVKFTREPHSIKSSMCRIILETASFVTGISRRRLPCLIISAGSGGWDSRVIYPLEIFRKTMFNVYSYYLRHFIRVKLFYSRL